MPARECAYKAAVRPLQGDGRYVISNSKDQSIKL